MREALLELLQRRPGTVLSAEEISSQLQLTRAELEKQIEALQFKSQILGSEIELFDELPSTQDLAKELARKGAKSGTVIVAKRQTRGRGRMQRLWESPPGGLWLSIILKPNLDLADAAKLTLSVSVALAVVFWRLYGLEVRIKWPNDLVIAGKKLAGILGEVVGEWNVCQTIVLGIGINVNFKRELLESEYPATTLSEHIGKEVNLNQLLAELLFELEKEVVALENNDSRGLKERWLAHAAGLGDEVIVECLGERWTGRFMGIKDSGELILEHQGEEKYFSSGDVKMRAIQDYFTE